MFQFVYWLKAVAAILITNSHYADIWPMSSLAMGGHFGNCIYFFLSGFCLCHIKDSFPKWYAKRLIRIYPALWIAATVDFLVGRTSADSFIALVHCYLYPTWYHFITSIMLLYILFYVVRYIQVKLKLDTFWFVLAVLLGFLILYGIYFDKSYYHIDDVSEKWVRFQFAESMLLGVLLREKYDVIKKKITCFHVIGFLALLICYFAGKLAVSHFAELSVIQCCLPMILVLLVVSIAVLFIKIEKNGFFQSVNQKLSKLVIFLSGITLEVYLVQPLVIAKLGHMIFPVNFILVTSAIILYAWILHKCSTFIQRGCNDLLRL